MAAVLAGVSTHRVLAPTNAHGAPRSTGPRARPTRSRARLAAIAWATALAIVGSSAQGHDAAQQKYQMLSAGLHWNGGTMNWYYAPAEQPAWADTASMVALIQQAMNAWSMQCGVQFSYAGTTGMTPTAQDGTSVVGWVPTMQYASTTNWYMRDGLMTEADIELNASANGSATATYPMLLHEIGHAIGLAHSEVQTAVMAGPPASPGYSYASTLQPDDVAGCQALYGPARNAVRAQMPASMASADTIAVEYYHPGLDHYFMTASTQEQATLVNGGFDGQWRPTGVTYPVWKAASPNLQPMCRFYGDWTIDPQTGKRRGPDSHFYTANPTECAIVPQRWPVWILEGSTFYAALPDATGACPAGTQPVYRFFRPQGDPNHRYVMTDALKQEMTARGWTPEGVAWCAGT